MLGCHLHGQLSWQILHPVEVFLFRFRRMRHKCLDHVARYTCQARKGQGRLSIDRHGLMEPFDADEKARNILEMVDVP